MSRVRPRLLVTGWLVSLAALAVTLAELRLVPVGLAELATRRVRRRHEADLRRLRAAVVTPDGSEPSDPNRYERNHDV